MENSSVTVAGAEQKDVFLHSKPGIRSREGASGDQTDLRWTPRGHTGEPSQPL